MALPNWVRTAQRPVLSITWYREGTTTPEPLTGATLTGTIKSEETGVTRAITGTLAVTDGANGVFSWTLSAADVATAGSHRVQFTAAFGSGATPAITFVTDWFVEDVQSVS